VKVLFPFKSQGRVLKNKTAALEKPFFCIEGVTMCSFVGIEPVLFKQTMEPTDEKSRLVFLQQGESS
jgi:hypothetical protein